MDGVVSLKEVPERWVSMTIDDDDDAFDRTYLLAKDIWQVKHLKGLTLVSVRTCQPTSPFGSSLRKNAPITYE